MTEHERSIVNMFNRYFENSEINGIAHRKKMSRFTSQLCDVLVDSQHHAFYLAIEAKSIKEKKNNKLYFSTHFSENDNGHQVERIGDFIDRSGRVGLLCLELKRGRGKARECYMLPFHMLRNLYDADDVGMPIDAIKEFGFEVKREGSEYVMTEELKENLAKYEVELNTR